MFSYPPISLGQVPRKGSLVAPTSIDFLSGITGMLGRWKASDLNNLAAAAEVVAWADNYGAQGAAVRGAGGSRPTMLKNAINGNSAIQTANVVGMLDAVPNFSSALTYTFATVFNYYNGTPGGETGLFGAGDGSSLGFRTGMGAANVWEYTVPSGGNFLTTTPTISSAAWHYMIMTLDPSATPKVSIYVDSGSALTWASAPSSTMQGTTNPGVYFCTSAPQNSFNQIAEFIVWTQALGSTDRGTVNTYFKNTYGL